MEKKEQIITEKAEKERKETEKNLLQMLIGQRIRDLRETRGITRETLALRAGLSPSCLNGVEPGRRNCSLMTLHELAGAPGVPLSDLVDNQRAVSFPLTTSRN